MAEDKDYFSEKLRLVERARENAYFRKLDQALLEQMRQHDRAGSTAAAPHVPEMFASILVPVDFSVYSAQALHYAMGIAERFTASLIVLHVISREATTHAMSQRLGYRHLPFLFLPPAQPPSVPEVPSEVAEDVIIDLREQAYTALQAFLPARIAPHAIELRVLVGQPFERILETATHEKVGLIVLGTHGRTGLAHLVMGSVAERVVRLAPCPVLTVKESEHGSTSPHA
jgi:nucleotide-binding universal stress UspA family protein